MGNFKSNGQNKILRNKDEGIQVERTHRFLKRRDHVIPFLDFDKI